MKIGIIGDTHYGAGYNLGKLDPKTQFNSRLLDFVHTFDDIITEFIKKGVKTAVLTGDIFETRHPTSAQLNAFSKCVQKAVSNGIDIVIVVGNHDQQRTISTTTVDIFKSLETPGIFVYPDFGLHPIGGSNDEPINIILMPYRDRRMMGTKTNADAIIAVGNKLKEISKNVDGKKIVVGHFMMDKSVTGENPDSFSINELILPLEMFDGFDAVIMGHVHKHAVLSKDPPIIYCGSMDRVSFGEKQQTKVSLIIDTDNISNIEVIKNNVRDMYEINLDYSGGEKYYKNQITNKIILDIDKYNMKWNLKGAIVKVVIKVKENDLHYVNQNKIRECVINKNVQHLSPLQVSSVNIRKLRNKNITEDVSGKKAMAAFIRGLIEPEQVKKRLIRFANNIITEVEGK